jgi:hypothetical protein
MVEMKSYIKSIEKLLKQVPKFKVIPIKQTRDEKKRAELLTKIMEHDWPIIESRIKNEILYKMQRCYLYGEHKWIGYGESYRHICRVCGLKAGTAYDPKFTGEVSIYWDK